MNELLKFTYIFLLRRAALIFSYNSQFDTFQTKFFH